MDWIQTLTIIGTTGAIVMWMTNKLDNDIKSLGNRLDGHAQRIDQLYGIIIDMLKKESK